jgi:uncharacterized protein YjbI with pentapeptide repeats
MKYNIQNRHTGEIQFTANFACADDFLDPVKIGLAVRWAIENDVNLRYADLRKADLHGANLREADLHGALLSKANLSGANLHGALLSEANLRYANLHGANLCEADLTEANLREANLTEADLHNAFLSEANLSRAHGILRVGPSVDGYEFFGVVRDDRVWIKAGCRWFTSDDARTHWNKTRGGTSLGAERIRFVNFIEAQMLPNKI